MSSFHCYTFIFLFYSLLCSTSGTGRITPLLYHNASACLAENLRMTNRYICDAEAHVVCIGGWSDPESLCSKPVCDMNGKGCVHGDCIYPNVCACKVGWDGPNCEECVPMGGCRHGTCEKPMECNCFPGWTGGLCEKAECNHCEHGCCHEPNKCICDFGWQGNNCSECLTLPNCKHGQCINHPYECECDPGWEGLGCSKPICRETCHPKNGYCKQPGECLCKKGWTGRDCNTCVPYPGCKGVCVNNIPWTCSQLGSNDTSKPDQWSEWSEWSSCSKTCGEGEQKRERMCGSNGELMGNCIGQSFESRRCTIKYCAVDGIWARWNKWSPCSTSCGTGLKQRSRSCSQPIPKFGGKPCEGQNKESIKCFNRFCPIDGRWSIWAAWGQCSVSCGNGKRERIRNCDSPTPTNGGMSCMGNARESENCNEGECPIDAEWSIWTQWTVCSKSCGEGQRERTRTCSEPQFGGRQCPGDAKNERDVIPCWIQETCPIDGGWSEWELWSVCSTTCGDGSRMRHRRCNNPSPQFGGQMCIGNKLEEGNCAQLPCPIDGTWAEWKQWSSCSVSCGGGNQKRERECNKPQNGGRPCGGLAVQTQQCSTQNCPIDGIWQQWLQWTTCSKSCNGGLQTRTRTCTPGQFGGKPCEGSGREQNSCNQQSCPIDGSWEQWSQWSVCTKSCDGGLQTRTRTCTPGQFGGKPCEGSGREQNSCNQQPCPIDGSWEQWSQWSVCTKSCDGGVQSRTRTCTPGQFGGRHCEGSGREQNSCNQQPCPIDGSWEQWSQWSVCTKSCDGGVQSRSRTCRPGQFGGRHCEGSGREQNSCNQQPCPIDGSWEQWSQWSVCTKSCGGGVQSRSRTCRPGQFGGRHCEGSGREQNSCNQQPCLIIGTWEQWQQWSRCSVSCGDGVRSRTRNCPTIILGQPCPGLQFEQSPCNERLCGTDGGWGQWLQWGTCSVSCGSGSRMRARHCDSPPPQNGGKPCVGSLWDKETCFQQSCSTNGNWGAWGQWSSCLATCGNSTQTRERRCDSPPPTNGGALCIGNENELQQCQVPPCPIAGGFSEWTRWSPCTVSCIGDRGDQVRRRFCDNPPPQNGGSSCNGEIKQKRFCTGTIPKQESNPSEICYFIGEKK